MTNMERLAYQLKVEELAFKFILGEISQSDFMLQMAELHRTVFEKSSKKTP